MKDFERLPEFSTELYDVGSFILYVRNNLSKTNISYPLIRTYKYQEVRNNRFAENFANILNE